MDYFIIHSARIEKHLQYLSLIFEPLKKCSFYTKLCKCKFIQTRLVFAGQGIDEQGIFVAVDKIKLE